MRDLTERQKTVLTMIAEGMTTKEIARRLELSPGTIKIHTAAIFRNLDVSNRTQAAVKLKFQQQSARF